MSNCEEIFQKIQRLQKEVDELETSGRLLESLSSINKKRPKGEKVPGTDGQDMEIDPDLWWARMSTDPDGVDPWVDRAVGQRKKAAGAEGVFENVEQLVNNMGEMNAKELLRLLQRQTGDWEFYNQKDFNLVTEKMGPKKLAQNISRLFADVNVDIAKSDINLLITENVGPFLGILNNQVKLAGYRDITLAVFRKELLNIADQLQAKGKVSVSDKRLLMKKWATAIFAHRSFSIAKRRWGQMGLNLQQLGKENPAKIDSIYRTTGREAAKEVEEMAEDILTATTEDLVTEDSLIGQVITAIDKGKNGIDDLNSIQTTLKLNGVDPNMPIENGWKNNWEKLVRAGYKDSMFFATKSQGQQNWLAQKIVYVTEGTKSWSKVAMEMTDWPFKRFTQRNLTPEQKDLFTPYGTEFSRNYFKAMWDSGRMHLKSHMIVDRLMKQNLTEIFEENFFKGHTPFAGAIDRINNNRGMLSVDEQYALVEYSLKQPIHYNDWLLAAMEIRDKSFNGTKHYVNGLIEKRTGKRLPVWSALQLMTAVDHRAGKRAYLAQRHIDLTLEAAKKNPTLDPEDWALIAEKQLDDQIYQITPTKKNIDDYRTEFDLSEVVSDDEIAAAIAMDRAGAPVLALPEQLKAYEKSFAMRMQKPLEGPEFNIGPKKVKMGIGEGIEETVQFVRDKRYGDALIPVWRSAAAQTVYDIALGNPYFMGGRFLNVIYHGFNGTLTTKMIADAHSAAITFAGIWAMFKTMDEQGLIEGNGPLPGSEDYQQWRAELAERGAVPNSIFGIPWNMGGLGVFNTLFLWKDWNDANKRADENNFDDMQRFSEALLTVGAGQLMRMPGLKQFQMMMDAFTQGEKSAWFKLAGFLGAAQIPPFGYFSGSGRTIEGMTGTSRTDLWRPRSVENDETRFNTNQVWTTTETKDSPIEKMHDLLKNMAYGASPIVASTIGVPKKQYTWLGRSIGRPDGHIGKWLIGQPGLWGEGLNEVEKTLDHLGMLDTPKVLMTQRVDFENTSIPIDTDIAKKINYQLGHFKPENYSDNEHRNISGVNEKTGIAYKFITIAKGRDADDPTSEETFRLDVLELLDEAVSGRTVREAMNYVINSNLFKQWESQTDSRTGNSIYVDRTKAYQRTQPGAKILKEIKRFYVENAKATVLNNDPLAEKFRARRQALIELGSLENAEAKFMNAS